MKRRTTIVFLCAAGIAPGCFATDPAQALRDPWVPPHVLERARTAKAPMSASVDDLRAQVEKKLRESFDAADVEKKGSITREQAMAAQLGIVANNFDAMDAARTGRVTFHDYKRFLRARGARTL